MARIKTLLQIILGTGMLAFAIKCIYDPCEMVVGGFSGLAIIVKAVSAAFLPGGIPLGLTTFVLNIPVFAAAIPIKGFQFVKRTLFASIVLSVWLTVIPDLQLSADDFVLASIFGGVASGAGIGLVLATGSSSGGTDMLASLLQKLFPWYTVAQIMAVLDGVIILLGGFLFGFSSALYAVVSVYITTKVSDTIVVGTRYGKSVFIITKYPDVVAKAVLEDLDRGITGIYAKGMYTGEERSLLYCVVSKKEIVKLKQCVREIDLGAFVIVSEVQEVLGEGFRQID